MRIVVTFHDEKEVLKQLKGNLVILCTIHVQSMRCLLLCQPFRIEKMGLTEHYVNIAVRSSCIQPALKRLGLRAPVSFRG